MPGEGGAAGPRGSGAVGAHRGAPLWTRISSLLRKIAGMPDYIAYAEHLRSCHPDQPVPTERQFYEDFIRRRYGDGPTRCC
jgi:uncharacterized short protein YbdD (DUF466 family)